MNLHPCRVVCVLAGGLLLGAAHVAAQSDGTLLVRVVSESRPVEQAEVRAGTVAVLTNANGDARLALPAGSVDVTVDRFGFEPAKVRVTLAAGVETRLTVELREQSVVIEDVVVTATRTTQRIQDLPIRVEVVPLEEIDEKLSMTPGDVAMMLTETNGLRVQVTSPSLGAANVRVQGLRGRYTQILADGLPLYGQTGSIGLLQIPPMDLGQVEVIKGVASALYGASALGGVINLVSRRPQPQHNERELLVNRTSRGGTDGVVWLSNKGDGEWGYTVLGGAHLQERKDVNGDGWSDLPGYRRALLRPRLLWENDAGRSLFVTAGALVEDREGGTVPGAAAPDGAPFPEDVTTHRFDAGLVGRFLIGKSRIVSIRSSGLGLWHGHRFGQSRERDFHHTWFAEGSMNGTMRHHTWVIGAALQRDAYRARDLPAFDYTFVVPGAFVQDDYAPSPWLTMSGSARLDIHSDFGTFFSPRISVLAKSGAGWTLRVSTGTGFYVPTPFTDETEATGLSRLAPIRDLEPERGRSLSVDVGWKRQPVEVTATLFRSSIDDVLLLRERESSSGEPVEIINAPGAGRTVGSELIGRLHYGQLDVIATHMYVWATEPDPIGAARREVPLTPRHTAGIDLLWNVEGHGRLGIEAFYTGAQHLADSPFRRRSPPYWLFGVIGELRVGRARVFLNSENLANVRQTRYHPIVRPSRAPDGRWTVDEWGPLDGRVFNAGVRLRF
jgi:outer membrane receptor for ferrienterochelin and colicins